VIARLKQGVTLEQARTDLNTIASRLEEAYPETNAGHGTSVTLLSERLVRDVRPALLLLLVAVAFVLLIACVNVANLLLAGAAGRRQEIAIRSALGASRARIVRQVLTESIMLALAGGCLGLLLSFWAVSLFAAAGPGNIPRLREVGEEGEGDLRGVRYLFESGAWSDRINAFVSFDGPDVERITNAAIGSRRYRATFRGSGGHSWGDFGVANPVNALGKVVSILSRYPAPAKPRTTFNVGRISGGTGTNVIPVEASLDVDLRSEANEELQRLDAFFRRALRQVVDEENAQSRRPLGTLQLDLKMIGDRPLGITANATRIVKLAEQATRAVGVTPKLDRSSTDANIPISLGIPAVTLGAGGKSGKTHTLDEWYDPKGRDLGLSRGLLLALAMVGVAG